MMETAKDKMTPRERMEAFAGGLPIDRIPCTCHLSEYGSTLIGVSVDDYHHSSDLMVKSALTVFRELGLDSVSLGPDLLGIPEALGARLAFSHAERPQLMEAAIRVPEAVVELPELNPEKDGRIPLYLDALVRVNGTIGHEVRVGTGVGGPFTTAAMLRGTDLFLRDLRNNPDFAHVLLERSTDAILAYMKAARDRGISCSLGEPLASVSVISPHYFREFVKPYISHICDWVKSKSGKGPTLHICGDTKFIWQDMVATGASFLSLDNTVDLEEAKNEVGDRAGITGNIPPVEVMLIGTPSDVIDVARECIRKAFDTPKGFILSSGCTVPLKTSPGNILAMKEAAKHYGSYPVDRQSLER
jgi:uroporphyrinogen decarboxylase